MSELDRSPSIRTLGTVVEYGMGACCAAILILATAYFAGSDIVGRVLSHAVLLGPLILCAGAHLVMRRFMGKSSQGYEAEKNASALVTPVQISRRQLAAE